MRSVEPALSWRVLSKATTSGMRLLVSCGWYLVIVMVCWSIVLKWVHIWLSAMVPRLREFELSSLIRASESAATLTKFVETSRDLV